MFRNEIWKKYKVLPTEFNATHTICVHQKQNIRRNELE